MSLFDPLRKAGFEILTLHHAEAILLHDMPSAVSDLCDALLPAQIPMEELVRGGGGEGVFTQRLRKRLNDELGWRKHNFVVKRVVDTVERESISHEIDHIKQFDGFTFALELEWNNKDPFFDRDLENFKRLHADGVISVGGIITRGESLQNALRELAARFAQQQGWSGIDDLSDFYTPTPRQEKLIANAASRECDFARGWAHAFTSDKFGEATTHWRKLMDRVQRGVGNPCPLILIGIPDRVIAV